MEKLYLVARTSFLVLLFFLASIPLAQAEKVEESIPLWGDTPFEKPNHVRGIHLTSWFTGSQMGRKKFEPLLEETELNTVVIDVKEINGEIYIPGVQWDDDLFTSTDTKRQPFRRAIRDIQDYLVFLKERGVFTIARIVAFQDQILPKERPELAIQSLHPIEKATEMGFESNVWVDWRGLAWVDPYNPKVQKYNIDVAERAAQLGFQGIQFDYFRFPSDGNTRWCRYSAPHTSTSGPRALAGFLKKARERLAPYKVELSIDVFGLVGSYKNDLGIGQRVTDLIENIDVLSPMMYPSHYGLGEYGLEDPNDFPYETVYRSVKDTLKELSGSNVKLRPFLQDFSLKNRKVKYGPDQVRAQIKAAEDQGVMEWLLWNARCRYTRDALRPTNN